MSNTHTDMSAAARTLDPEVVSRVLKALSNPNRLRIFLLLRDERAKTGSEAGLRVGRIAETLDVTQSTVSHHLRELEHAGLIRLERQGKSVYCSVLCRPFLDVVDFLECDLE